MIKLTTRSGKTFELKDVDFDMGLVMDVADCIDAVQKENTMETAKFGVSTIREIKKAILLMFPEMSDEDFRDIPFKEMKRAFMDLFTKIQKGESFLE